MTAPLSILTVCIGNRCRSPLAERLLQRRLDAAWPGSARVASVGTGTGDGFAMDRSSAAQLVRLGGDPDGFASRRASTSTLEGHDLVLTATKAIRTQVLELSPRLMKRTFTLAELAAVIEQGDVEGAESAGLVGWAASRRHLGADAADIADPIGTSEAVHRAVADQIAGYVDTIVDALVRVGA